MAAVFQSNVFQANVFQVGTASAGHVFQCNVFQGSVFQQVGCGVSPPPIVVPTTQGDPGGYDEQSRKRAEEFAARRAIAERQARPVVPKVETVVQQPEQPKPVAEPVKLEPAPTLLVQMGDVAVGIKTPSLTEAIRQQTLADDEDAIRAILALL